MNIQIKQIQWNKQPNRHDNVPIYVGTIGNRVVAKVMPSMGTHDAESLNLNTCRWLHSMECYYPSEYTRQETKDHCGSHRSLRLAYKAAEDIFEKVALSFIES